ncbi:hypothetical protein CFE70_000098 [Pyrenophora teres f. teres 0-1]|uniref:C2H2-type domain-containing protein n=1 Tax=Pyrenophora teres f. teres (strain 0-1) TaxID=861557 RepID=E3S741_PYRTT|nr:hypothetical protein PTT_18607 [Pyrenophora teres f. teres 0-1]
MAPIIIESRSTESIAAPSYTKRALTSHNDVSLAIGLTVSLVCFGVILVAVWCLLRRRRRLGAIPVDLESAASEISSPVVEICSNSTKSLYKYEGDSPSYYSPLSPVALLELDAGTPRNENPPFSQSSPVSNSLSRYPPPNGESSSASERTFSFSKDYYFSEPDRRSHPSNISFNSSGTGSSKYPRKQDINVQINFVNPREVEYRPNCVLQAEEHAIFLSLSSLQPRSRPASIQDKTPHYLGMDTPNTDITNKGSRRISRSPLPDRDAVPRVSTLREKLTHARGLQELHPLSIVDVPSEPSYDCRKSTQKQEKRRNQRSHPMEISSSTSSSTPPSHSNKSSPISATTTTTTTSPTSSITPSTSPISPSTPVFQCPSCRLTFRTPGLRRNHHNRRHNLRYTCIVCTAPFGLRADLDRHQYTRHPEQYRAADRFWCTVEGCENPGKEWSRKDNFERHVRRCEGKGERSKGKGKERAVS